MGFYLLGSRDTTRWVLERGGVVYAVGHASDRDSARRELQAIQAGLAPPQPRQGNRGWVIAFIDRDGRELGRGLHEHPSSLACAEECMQALRPSPVPGARLTV